MADDKWIEGAIERPGALRAKAKDAGAMTEQGTIKRSWLEEQSKGNDRTAKQARLALKLRKANK